MEKALTSSLSTKRPMQSVLQDLGWMGAVLVCPAGN